MKLFIINIGGKRAPAICETHEMHALIAEDFEQAVRDLAPMAKATFSSPHLDGYVEINLRSASDPQTHDLFFVETGSNGPGIGEAHRYRLLWANGTLAARNVAKNYDRTWHVDTVFNVSKLARKAGYDVDGDANVPLESFSHEAALYQPLT